MSAFISINLPKEVQDELARAQEKIKDPDVKMITVNPSKIHLTLKFLGEITENRVEKVSLLMKEMKFKKFKAKLIRVGVFPNPNFIKVVWVGLDPREEFVKINKSLNESLSKIRFKHSKLFEPHATLARVKSLKDKTKYFEKIHQVKIKPIEFTVDKIHLMKSIPSEKGHIYEDIFYLELE